MQLCDMLLMGRPTVRKATNSIHNKNGSMALPFAFVGYQVVLGLAQALTYPDVNDWSLSIKPSE